MIKVAIVEDDAGVRQSLEWLVKSIAGIFAGFFLRQRGRSVARAAKRCAGNRADGHQSAKSFRHRMHRAAEGTVAAAQVVMITVYDETDKVFNALRAGASGYILKRSTPERILQAIREVHAGGVPMSSEIARKVLGAFREPVARDSTAETLSRREQEVLELLAQGCSNKEIADKLSISIETVTWHLRHIYAKLHVRSRTQAALRFLNAKTGA